MRLLIFEKSNSYLNYAAFHLLFYSLFFSHFFSEFYVISLDFFEFVFHFIPPSSILITVAFYFDNSSLFVSLPIHKNNFFEFTLIPILENALHLYKVYVNPYVFRRSIKSLRILLFIVLCENEKIFLNERYDIFCFHA